MKQHSVRKWMAFCMALVIAASLMHVPGGGSAVRAASSGSGVQASASSGSDVDITSEEIAYPKGTYDTSVVEQSVLFSHTDPTSEIDFDESNLTTPEDNCNLSCDDKLYDALGFDSDELNDTIDNINADDSYKDSLAGYSYMDPNELVIASVNRLEHHETQIRVSDNVLEDDVSQLDNHFNAWGTNSTASVLFDEGKDYQTHNVVGADLDGDGTDEMVYLSLRADGDGGFEDIDIYDKKPVQGGSYVWEMESGKRTRISIKLSTSKEILDIKASSAKSYTAITAGDFDNDGSEDIAFYAPAKGKDSKGITAKVYIYGIKPGTNGWDFTRKAEIYLRDIAPDTAMMDSEWHLPVVSLSTTRTRLNGENAHDSKSVTKYNVYEDLVINISTPNISAYNKADLNMDSFTAIYGMSGDKISQLFKTEYKVFEKNGSHYRISAVNSCDADLNGDGFDEIVVAGIGEVAKGDDFAEAGDYDENFNYVNVISNTKGSYEFTWDKAKAVPAAPHLDPNNFGSLEPVALCGGHFDGSTGDSFDQICVGGVIFGAENTRLTGTPTYAETDTNNNCTYAMISDTQPDNNKENLPENEVTFAKLYEFDITDSKGANAGSKNSPWIDCAISGHFLTESKVDAIVIMSNDATNSMSNINDQINMDLTLIAYDDDPDITVNPWKSVTNNDYVDACNEDDNGTSLAICFINSDNDSFHYRYRGTYATYSAPKLYTIVQAPPFYEELNDTDVKYTLTSGVSARKALNLGLSFSGSFTIKVVEISPSLGFSYAREATHNKTTSQTFDFYSDKDYALVYTVPTVANIYDIIIDETGESQEYVTYEPLAPQFVALSVDDYNRALMGSYADSDRLPATADAQVITADMLPPSSSGDPMGYAHSLNEAIGINSVDNKDRHLASVESGVNTTSEILENTLEFSKSTEDSLGANASLGVKLKFGNKGSIGVDISGGVDVGYTSTSGMLYTLYYYGIPNTLEYGISFDPRSGFYDELTKIRHYSPSDGVYNYNSTAVAYRLSDVADDFDDKSVMVLSFYTTGIQFTPEQPDSFNRKSVRKNADGSADITLSWISETKDPNREAEGYNLYLADINSNVSTVHLLNTEGMIPKASNSKYTTYKVHLDNKNYSDACVFYIAPAYLNEKSGQIEEGAIDRKVSLSISAQTSGNVIIVHQPENAKVKKDASDESIEMTVSVKKDEDIDLGSQKIWCYWMMQEDNGSFMSLQTDSLEVSGQDDLAEKTSTLKLDIPGAKKGDYVEKPVICRIVYGNYSVTSDGVMIKYEEEAKPVNPEDSTKKDEETKKEDPVVKSVSVKSVKQDGKKQILLKWKKNKDASGYQIQYKAKGGKYKSVNILKSGKTSYKIRNLKRGKKYFVRIRAFKKYDGKKIYSKWSKKKSVKMK